MCIGGVCTMFVPGKWGKDQSCITRETNARERELEGKRKMDRREVKERHKWRIKWEGITADRQWEWQTVERSGKAVDLKNVYATGELHFEMVWKIERKRRRLERDGKKRRLMEGGGGEPAAQREKERGARSGRWKDRLQVYLREEEEERWWVGNCTFRCNRSVILQVLEKLEEI